MPSPNKSPTLRFSSLPVIADAKTSSPPARFRPFYDHPHPTINRFAYQKIEQALVRSHGQSCWAYRDPAGTWRHLETHDSIPEPIEIVDQFP